MSPAGIRPTERIRVSQSTRSSVPGMGRKRSSTREMVTPSSRARPWMSVTVWLRCRGMP